MTQIVITMKVYENSEAVPVYDIKLGIRWRHAMSFKFQSHFASEERAPQHPVTYGWMDITLVMETTSPCMVTSK